MSLDPEQRADETDEQYLARRVREVAEERAREMQAADPPPGP